MNNDPSSPASTLPQAPIIIDAIDPRLKIMVSSTTVDLPDHRNQVIGAINRMGHTAVVMEHGSAEWQSNAIKFSLEKVMECQVYIGIFAQRYGHIPASTEANPDQLSVTELEYREAVKLGRPTLLFFADDTHPFLAGQMDFDADKRAKLERLKAELQASEICGFFGSPDKLREEVFMALQRLQVRLGQPNSEIAAVSSWMPSPPELLAVPRYTLTGTFVGRSSELTRLDEWARSGSGIMVVEGIGGLGKSAVTWEWMTTRAAATIPRLAGCVWWSFYEEGTSLVTFVRCALAYITGKNPDDLRAGWSHYQLGEQLIRELKSRPYLLVLDGFERVLAAYHQMDKGLIPDHQVEEHRCECIHPQDGVLLVQLLHCMPSKILISTRLFPTELLDRGSRRPAAGVDRHLLNGLSPADALTLVRHAGITGDEAAILAFADQFGRHSLLLKVVCGLIADYRRRPLDFAAWLADPSAGGGLKLAKLGLTQRRTNILHFALAGITPLIRTLLCRIAIMGAGVTYDTIEVLNPFQPPRSPDREKWEDHEASPEYLNGLKKLDAALQELEDRGLLQWDRESNRYDMHPIVRLHAAEMLDVADRTATFQTAHDHFASLPPDNLKEATELTHVTRSLEIYRCLVGAGRTDEAALFIQGNLSTSLLFHIGAYPAIVEMLTPLFPQGFHKSSVVSSPALHASLLNTLAISFSYIGRDEEALTLNVEALRLKIDHKQWGSVSAYLRSLSVYLYDLDRRVEAAGVEKLARAIAEATHDEDDLTTSLWWDAWEMCSQGRYAEAEDALQRFRQRPLPPVQSYRPGDAERLRCRIRFEQGMLNTSEWEQGYALATRHRNLTGQYAFLALKAESEMMAGRPQAALDGIDEALQIVNRSGTPKPLYHDLRAWALASLARGAEARSELEKGKGRWWAAEAWLLLGEHSHATACALEGYRWAWGEGAPYSENYALQNCRRLLNRLNTQEPQLPAFDPASRKLAPFEAEIRAALPAVGPQRLIYIVRGKNRGMPAWYYVDVTPEKRAEFLRMAEAGALDVADYGQVVESGWGQDPPLSIQLWALDELDGPISCK